MRPIEMIPVEQIHVLNPRSRNKRLHREIIDNIGTIGLKRPITVSRKAGVQGVSSYDLVCGQGRLEAFQSLGHKEIPAFVVPRWPLQIPPPVASQNPPGRTGGL
jgi:ParB family chromosome partitioning protein